MNVDTGIIKVIQVDWQGERLAQVACPGAMIPGPGKYLLAFNPAEENNPLGHPLFQAGLQGDMDALSTPLLGPVPTSWAPGSALTLRGPSGRGFQGYTTARRLGIATFSGTISRLLPLLRPALRSGADVAVFLPDDLHAENLPAVVEVHPLQALAESLAWPGLLVLEIPLGELPRLRDWLQLGAHESPPCPIQALVLAPMPCGALGDCGACAVPARRGSYRLACKDGPVFDLNELDW